MNQQEGQVGVCGNQPEAKLKSPPQQAQCEPKLWVLCGLEEKIDRLRFTLTEMKRNDRWTYERFCRIEAQLQRLDNHQHGTDGTVLVRPRDIDASYGLTGGDCVSGYDPLA